MCCRPGWVCSQAKLYVKGGVYSYGQTEYTVKVECAATWSVVKLAMLKSSWLSWLFTSTLC